MRKREQVLQSHHSKCDMRFIIQHWAITNSTLAIVSTSISLVLNLNSTCVCFVCAWTHVYIYASVYTWICFSGSDKDGVTVISDGIYYCGLVKECSWVVRFANLSNIGSFKCFHIHLRMHNCLQQTWSYYASWFTSTDSKHNRQTKKKRLTKNFDEMMTGLTSFCK